MQSHGDPARGPLDLRRSCVGMHRSGRASVAEVDAGPPPAIDGYTVGAAVLTQPPPHGGECHLDGDELLVLLSGVVDIILEHPGGTETVQVVAPQAFVVPRSTWHRLVPNGPAEILFMTPGPNNEHRPAER